MTTGQPACTTQTLTGHTECDWPQDSDWPHRGPKLVMSPRQWGKGKGRHVPAGSPGAVVLFPGVPVTLKQLDTEHLQVLP